MNPEPESLTSGDAPPVRRPYAKPELKRVDLAMAETLSQGCKMEDDSGCVGPPVTGFESGS